MDFRERALDMGALPPGVRRRGEGTWPSICALKREYRIRAAWPLVMSSCEATACQSIYTEDMSTRHGRGGNGGCRGVVAYALQIELLQDGVQELGMLPVGGHLVTHTGGESMRGDKIRV